MAVIDYRGENNLYRNAVLNCIEVLKKFSSESGREIKQYYEEDVWVPKTPCFVVLFGRSDDEMRSSQNLSRIRYTIPILLEIRYYYEDLTEETKRNEITYVLWEVNELLKKNITLNGFVPKLGTEVTGVRWAPQPREENRFLAGGIISLLVKKLYSTSITL